MGNTGKRHTEAEIIAILKEAEAEGPRVGEVLRRHGVPAKTYCRWKAKLGVMELSDAKRLKEPEEENRRLKRIGASDAPVRARTAFSDSFNGKTPVAFAAAERLQLISQAVNT